MKPITTHWESPHPSVVQIVRCQCTYFCKLAWALGTKNVFSASTLDQMPKQLASGLMFGHWLSVALPDIARTETAALADAHHFIRPGADVFLLAAMAQAVFTESLAD